MKLTFVLKTITLFFLLTLTNSLLRKRRKVMRKLQGGHGINEFRNKQNTNFPEHIEEMIEEILRIKNIALGNRLHTSEVVYVCKAFTVKTNSDGTKSKAKIIIKVDIPDKKEHLGQIITSEADLMQKLGHVPFVINICGYFKAKVRPHQTEIDIMVLPEAADDVGKLIHAQYNTKQSFPEKTQIEMMYQMILGLANLHKRGFVHNDIKGNNYLMMKNKQIVLADLGESFEADNKIEALLKKGNIKYSAPELKQYGANGPRDHLPSFKSDVYSLGLLFARIHSIEFYYCSLNKEECIIPGDVLSSINLSSDPHLREKINLFTEELKAETELSKGRLVLLDLIFNRMLEKDPTKRISSGKMVQAFQKYFYQITDRIDKKYSSVQFCPVNFENDFNLIVTKQTNAEQQAFEQGMDDLFAGY